MSFNISLTDELKVFLDQKIASGEYASASDVIKDALRLLERHEENARRLEWLRNACREGIDSGDAGEINFEEIRAEGRAMLVVEAK